MIQKLIPLTLEEREITLISYESTFISLLSISISTHEYKGKNKAHKHLIHWSLTQFAHFALECISPIQKVVLCKLLKMTKLFCLLLIIFVNYENSCCFPLFFRGRPMTRHGMLGLPTSEVNLAGRVFLPQEQWVEQRLDHFNPADTRTWKQVFFYHSFILHKMC